MRRKHPITSDGYYHVYNRGVSKQKIYTNHKDYERCISCLSYYNLCEPPVKYSNYLNLNTEYSAHVQNQIKNSRKNVFIVAYCLMPNHFHFVLKQTQPDGISRFIGNSMNSYVRYFNIKYNRIGPLFQGPFKAKRINEEQYLHHVIRYIHLNPYLDGLTGINELEKYKWSSYQEYCRHRQNKLVNTNFIEDHYTNIDDFVSFTTNHAEHQRKIKKIRDLYE